MSQELNASFLPGQPYPYLYDESSPMATARLAREAQPVMTSAAGIRVFDMSKEEDAKALNDIVQLVAWNQAKFDTFEHQFDNQTGNFKILCVWRRFFRMPANELSQCQMRTWGRVK